MADNINLALQLLLVGMITVFFVLGVVVLLGRTLIYLVNKYSPDVISTQKQIRTTSNRNLSTKKIAIITAVVNNVTAQQGAVRSIKKL